MKLKEVDKLGDDTMSDTHLMDISEPVNDQVQIPKKTYFPFYWFDYVEIRFDISKSFNMIGRRKLKCFKCFCTWSLIGVNDFLAVL